MIARCVLFLALLACTGCASAFNTTTFANSFRLHQQLLPALPVPITGDTHAADFQELRRKAHSLGISVTVSPSEGVLWGYYFQATRTIWVNDTLNADTQLATLAHELGHALQPAELDGTLESQVFAEAVAALYCKSVGLDIWRHSFSYLSGQGTLMTEHVLSAYAREIEAAVALLRQR